MLFCIGELLEERESGKTDEASHDDKIVGRASRRLCAGKVVPFDCAKVNKRQLAAIIPKVKNWDCCTKSEIS